MDGPITEAEKLREQRDNLLAWLEEQSLALRPALHEAWEKDRTGVAAADVHGQGVAYGAVMRHMRGEDQ